MWLLVMFDLPVKTKTQRGLANRFRNFLKKDGYIMLQLSIYARICNGHERVKKHLARLKTSLPPEGSVKVLQITDRQYGAMLLLVGHKGKRDPSADPRPQQQLVLF